MGKKKEFTGIWIPRGVWEDDRLSVYDKIVMAVVSGLARGENGCFATNKHLAEFCRFSERQVSKSLAVLSGIGYIRLENAGTPVRRIYVSGSPEERTTCAVRTHDVRDKNAPCAQLERTTCAVRTHDVRASDENLPIILNYNNIYNKDYNNKAENKPTAEEIKTYIKEQGSSVDPTRFYKYYEAANWLDRKGCPINWRQKVLLWESSEPVREEGRAAEAVPGSFDTDEFFDAALARAGYDDTADEDCPWIGG